MIKVDSDNCTGCCACVSMCRAKVISMQNDKNGFTYPKLGEGCTCCGKCVSVCPIPKELFHAPLENVYIYQNPNADVLKRSTSGGVFYELARHVIDKGGVIYGCAYTKKFIAKHIRIDKIDNIKLLQGSKYVQSNMDGIIQQIEKDIKNGKQVLFSGTPCQNAGILSFFSDDSIDLLTVDFVCHGVPSQMMFDKYLEWFEAKHGGKVLSYSFRDKENGGWSLSGRAVVRRAGKCHVVPINVSQNWYYDAFLRGFTYRKSCYSCRYARKERIADITIGDFWGIEKLLQNTNKEGYSLIMINTDKAMRLANAIGFNKTEAGIELAIRKNAQLSHAHNMPILRDKLLEIIMNENYIDINRLYRKMFRNHLLILRLKELVPQGLKHFVKKHL